MLDVLPLTKSPGLMAMFWLKYSSGTSWLGSILSATVISLPVVGSMMTKLVDIRAWNRSTEARMHKYFTWIDKTIIHMTIKVLQNREFNQKFNFSYVIFQLIYLPPCSNLDLLLLRYDKCNDINKFKLKVSTKSNTIVSIITRFRWKITYIITI